MSDDTDRDDYLYSGAGLGRRSRRAHGTGGGGSGSDGGCSSSSDEDEIRFVSSSGGRKRGRFGYTTFGDDDDDDDDDGEDGEEGRGGDRKRRRARPGGGGGMDEALYGVFSSGGASDGSSDDDGAQRRRTGKRSRRTAGRSKGGGVSFVKSAAAVAEGESKGAMGGNDKADDEGAPGLGRREGGGEDDLARQEEERRRKEAEEADARFRALLEKSRGNKKARKAPRRRAAPAAVPSNRADGALSGNVPEGAAAAGLGLGLGAGQGGGRGGGLGFKAGGGDDVHDDSRVGDDAQQPGLGLGMRPQSHPMGRIGLGAGSKQSISATANGDASSSPSSVPPLSSFFSSSGGGVGLGASTTDGAKNKRPPMKRDPNLGTWEKHTKGIGMKLLSKMGYSGSGGLGAKRVRKKVVQPPPEQTIAPEVMHRTDHRGKEEEEKVVRKGISRPVEVVVRPANLGLGFGNFVEQSQLKVNRQIEAEVRGIDLKKQEEQERKKKLKEEGLTDLMEAVPKSLLPSTQSLVSGVSWRKGAGGGSAAGKAGRQNKKRERKFVSYKDVIAGDDVAHGKEKIIDMRGPSATTASSSAPPPATAEDGAVPLGEELLHNVTLLLNTYEDRIRSTSHYVRSNERKVASMKSELEHAQSRMEDVKARAAKLERVLDIFDRMERLQKQQGDDHDGDVEHVSSLIGELGTNFTDEEKASFQLHTVVVPSLLGPIAERRLVGWDPLLDGSARSKEVISSVLDLCSAAGAGDGGGDAKADPGATRRTMFVTHILPPVKRSLQSSKWDPVRDVESGLDLFEVTLSSARAASPPPNEAGGIANDENDEDVLLESPYGALNGQDGTKDLETVVKDEVMFNVVFPKLSRSLSQWKPSSTLLNNMQQDALHSWIVPWLPHLDYKSMLTTILPDVRRKLRSTLTFLSRTLPSGKDDAYFSACTNVLLPWRGLLDERTLCGLTSDFMTPRLGRYLSRTIVNTSAVKQDWKGVDLLLRLSDDGLISSRELLSLLEGEVMSAWAERLYYWLTSKDHDMRDVAAFYSAWKEKLLQPSKRMEDEHLPPSWMVLRNDAMICRHFYGALRMIEASLKSDAEALDELMPKSKEEYSYHTALARRAKEARLKEEEEMRVRAATEASALNDRTAGVSAHRSGGTATFKDVVEDFARQNDISFRPKMGANATKDGNQIFVFGAVSVYFDSNVVFALRGSIWQPTSFEDLVLANA